MTTRDQTIAGDELGVELLELELELEAAWVEVGASEEVEVEREGTEEVELDEGAAKELEDAVAPAAMFPVEDP